MVVRRGGAVIFTHHKHNPCLITILPYLTGATQGTKTRRLLDMVNRFPQTVIFAKSLIQLLDKKSLSQAF